MSLHALPGGRSVRPRRSGQPWTEEDYDALAALCGEGLDLAEVAERLGRTELAVLERARRMLPVDERTLPRDRALTRLKELLGADGGYDWSTAMCQAPPPPPVVHRVYRREGVAGLRTRELLAVAEALVLQPLCDGLVRERVLGLVQRRGLVEELEHQVGARLVHRAQAPDDPYGTEPYGAEPYGTEPYGTGPYGPGSYGPGSYGSAGRFGRRPVPDPPDEPEWERAWCEDECPVDEPETVPDVAPDREDPPWW